jgi:hypothetical protein
MIASESAAQPPRRPVSDSQARSASRRSAAAILDSTGHVSVCIMREVITASYFGFGLDPC